MFILYLVSREKKGDILNQCGWKHESRVNEQKNEPFNEVSDAWIKLSVIDTKRDLTLISNLNFFLYGSGLTEDIYVLREKPALNKGGDLRHKLLKNIRQSGQKHPYNVTIHHRDESTS